MNVFFSKFAVISIFLIAISTIFVNAAGCVGSNLCTGYSSQEQCEAQTECTWLGGNTVRCVGPNSCTSYSSQTQCDAQIECTWLGDDIGDSGDGAGASGDGAGGSSSGGQKSNKDFVADKQLINPITGIAHGEGADPFSLISIVSKNIINTLLGLVGIFAMIGFIWGGVTWMTSYGDTAKIERGKKMMTWGVVGLIVIFSSYAIANYIFQAIGAVQPK